MFPMGVATIYNVCMSVIARAVEVGLAVPEFEGETLDEFLVHFAGGLVQQVAAHHAVPECLHAAFFGEFDSLYEGAVAKDAGGERVGPSLVDRERWPEGDDCRAEAPGARGRVLLDLRLDCRDPAAVFPRERLGVGCCGIGAKQVLTHLDGIPVYHNGNTPEEAELLLLPYIAWLKNNKIYKNYTYSELLKLAFNTIVSYNI